MALQGAPLGVGSSLTLKYFKLPLKCACEKHSSWSCSSIKKKVFYKCAPGLDSGPGKSC